MQREVDFVEYFVEYFVGCFVEFVDLLDRLVTLHVLVCGYVQVCSFVTDTRFNGVEFTHLDR
jgi:hypothetical protein